MRYWENLTGPEVAQQIGSESICILPLGAIEQHGPHLPLSVDHVIATETAKAVVEKHGEELDLWLLPTIAVTKSNEHAWSPGTLWLSAQTLLAVLDDIAANIALTGAKKLVFLNAHGGNSSILNVACRDIRQRHNLQTFLVHPFVPTDQQASKDDLPEGSPDDSSDQKGLNEEQNSPQLDAQLEIHGGLQETSLMLYLKPDLVKMDLAVSNIPPKLLTNKYVKFGGQVTFGWLSNDFGTSGVIGDPTGSTAELGEELFVAVTAELGNQLKEIATFDFGR